MTGLPIASTIAAAYRVVRDNAQALAIRAFAASAATLPLVALGNYVVYRLDTDINNGGTIDSLLDVARWLMPALLVLAPAAAIVPAAAAALRDGQITRTGALSDLARTAMRFVPATIGVLFLTVAAVAAVRGFAELGAWLDAQTGLQGWWFLSYALGGVVAAWLAARGLLRTLIVAGVAAQSAGGLQSIREAARFLHGRQAVVAVTVVLGLAAGAVVLVPLVALVAGVRGLGISLTIPLVLALATVLAAWIGTLVAAVIEALRAIDVPAPAPEQRIPPNVRLAIIALGIATLVGLGDWTHDHETLRTLERDPMAAYRPEAATSVKPGGRADRTIHNLTLGFGDEVPDLEAFTSDVVEFSTATTPQELGGQVDAAAATAASAGWAPTPADEVIPYGGQPRTGIGSWNGTKMIDDVPARISIQASPDTVDFYDRDVRQYGQAPSVRISITSTLDE